MIDALALAKQAGQPIADFEWTKRLLALHRTALIEELSQGAGEPVAWGMRRSDGLMIDIITPNEHESHEGGYTEALYTSEQVARAVAHANRELLEGLEEFVLEFGECGLTETARALITKHGGVK